MNAVNLIPTLPAPATLRSFNGQQWRHVNPRCDSLSISSSLRRRDTKMKKNPKSSSDQSIEMVIDVEDISNRVSLSLRKFVRSSESRFHEFVSSGREALRDLRTLVKIDEDRRVVISCRRSSLHFVANLVLWGCVIASVVAFLVKLGLGLGFRSGYGVVVRRDRSLAGREVVVARRSKEMEGRKKGSGVSFSPLSPARGTVKTGADVVTQRRGSMEVEKKLPSWWPLSTPSPVFTMNKQEYQEEANRLIRAIMDNRMSGMDIKEDDIIQLRQICRNYGVRVSIDTANARDYLYRAAVNLVLNVCSSWMSHSTTVQIDGEDAQQFISGLANNVGLEGIRAAKIVSGAVAARTRSCFLQAWALEMQGRHSEAFIELSQICLIHRTFPPEESSPEMEMVARSLERNLRVEQREFLMKMLVDVCDAKFTRSAAEALGLMPTAPSKYAGDEKEAQYY